jgi:hypothetical protein
LVAIILLGTEPSNGTILVTVVISDNIDYTSGFTSGVAIDNVEFSYSGIAYNAPDFTTSGGPKLGLFNYSVEYSPIDSSLLTLLEAALIFLIMTMTNLRLHYQEISHIWLVI